MDAAELTQKVEKSDFRALYQRMDADYDLWDLAKRKIEDYDIMTKAFQGARDTDVTFVSPSPRSFADHVQARLSAAELQVIVRLLEKEGEDKRDDIAKLERLMVFALEKADDRLTNLLLLPPLREYSIWCATMRGRVACRVLVEQDDEGVIFNILPQDPRFIKYELGSKGFLWVSYTTYRSSEAIKEEYDKEGHTEKDNEVTDLWMVDGKKINNAVFSNNEFLKELTPHDIQALPIIYLPVPSIPPISGKDTSIYGDSIFSGAREIFKFENDLVSMWASHAKLLFKQPTINYYDDEGKELTTTAFLSEAVINLPMGHNRLEPSPLKEISPTLVNLVGYVGGLRQRVTLPDIEYGELRNFPLSGTAINELQQARSRVFGPLLRTLDIFYTNICLQIEQQLIHANLPVTVKSELDRKYYEVKVSPIDLKKPHTLRAEFTVTTPWSQLDTYQIADMAKRLGLPNEFIWEYIMKLPDPKGLSDQAAVEIAEHSPTLLRLKAITTLLKQGRQDEAKTLIEELYNEWMQAQQMQAPPEPAGPEQAAPEEMGGGI